MIRRAVLLAGLGAGLLLAACGGGNREGESGRLCGVAGLEGEYRADITVPGSRCGIDNPVAVTRVAGVALSRPAILGCDAARALHRWVDRDAKRIVGNRGGGLEQLDVAASYACRTRNHRRGARLSEHALGNAIDISAFRLADGSRISVLRDWRDGVRRDRRILQRLHGSACGPFGTVLGPESDRFHQDHFHFDVARHRGGPYCR